MGIGIRYFLKAFILQYGKASCSYGKRLQNMALEHLQWCSIYVILQSKIG